MCARGDTILLNMVIPGCNPPTRTHITIYTGFPEGMELKSTLNGEGRTDGRISARGLFSYIRIFFLAYVSLYDSLWGILGSLS